MIVAVLCLGLVSHLSSAQFESKVFFYLFLSGLVGFGIGDCASKALSRYRNYSVPIRAEDSTATKCSWVVIAALSGPVVGIAFFQWALIMTEAAIAQAIVAMTPIVIMPFAYCFEGERPSRRSIVGGVIAVGGVMLLLFL